MAIPNYIRPQLTIQQILAETPSASPDRISPIVIGPQFLLSRYGKETTNGVAFDTAGMDIPYTYYSTDGTMQVLPNGHVVDIDSVKVFGEGLEASLAAFTAASGTFKLISTSQPNVIKIQTNLVAGTGTLNTSLRGRDVKVGDIVYTKPDDADGTVRRRTVVGLRGVDVAATTGTASNSVYNPITDLTADAAVTVSAPTGWTITSTGTPDFNVRGASVINALYGEEFTLTVRTGGAAGVATVDIASKSGKYSATNVATASDSGTGYDITDAAASGELAGIDINLDQGGDLLVAGQVFKVRVFQAYERLVGGSIAGGNQIATAGTYTGTKDTSYLIKVKTGTAATGDTATGAVVTITDTAGIDVPSELTITDGTPFAVGSYGVTATIQLTDTSGGVGQDNTVVHGGLRAGDTYVVEVTAAKESTTSFDKVVLDGPAVDTTTFVDIALGINTEFRLAFSGEILKTASADLNAWSATQTSVSLDSAHSLLVSERSAGYTWVPFVDGVGKVHTSYRAYVPAPSIEDKVTINSVDDITTKLGTIDPDNDLAYGTFMALTGVQGAKSVHALRTAGPSVGDYSAALRKIEATDMVYALAVLSDDLDVQQLVVTHCEDMSSKTKKNFRRCYVGTDSPGEYPVLSLKQDSTNYTATISDYAGANILLTTADDVDFRLLGLEVGDLVRLTASGDEYKIADVMSATEILLQAGPLAPVSPAVPFQLWRADTPSSQKDYVKARSAALGSRRCANVWTDRGVRGAGTDSFVLANKYLACEIAGLRCAVLPQQGLTSTEISAISSAPRMYISYTQEQLDEIAAAGTFVITQDAESGAVFIRHQLTTESGKGSLYYEDSVGVNLDNISFQVKDALNGYIGKKNVTADTILEINRDIVSILDAATVTTTTSSFGPALNGYENLSVAAHPTLKDRVVVYAKLLMPLPLNNIDVTLEGDVDLSL